MPSRPRRSSPRPDRIRSLIALDASNVMQRLTRRREEMVALFSRLRDRGPLLAAIESRVPSATFADLAVLQPNEQRAVNHFYELLGELHWYARYTEDMPLQMQQKVDRLAGDLVERHTLLMAVLGAPVTKGAVVEVEPGPAVLSRRSRAAAVSTRRGGRPSR